jgi:hypothetical protein
VFAAGGLVVVTVFIAIAGWEAGCWLSGMGDPIERLLSWLTFRSSGPMRHDDRLTYHRR